MLILYYNPFAVYPVNKVHKFRKQNKRYEFATEMLREVLLLLEMKVVVIRFMIIFSQPAYIITRL